MRKKTTRIIFAAFSLIVVVAITCSLFVNRRPSHQIDSTNILQIPRVEKYSNDFKKDIPLPALIRAMEKALPTSSKEDQITILNATHALRLWGKEADFCSRVDTVNKYSIPYYIFSSQTCLNMMLDNRSYRAMFPKDSHIMARTGQGVSVKQYAGELIASEVNSFPDCERHVDKIISVLSEIGVASSYPIYCDEIKSDVSDLIKDSMWRFYKNQEIDFSLKAYLHYLVPDAKWDSRTGDRYDFDELLKAIDERSFHDTACGGTHVCQDIALALHFADVRNHISNDIRSRLTEKLDHVCRMLETTQMPDGSWPANWFNRDEKSALLEIEADKIARLRVTSHHLEWIAFTSTDHRPKNESISRAIAFVIKALDEMDRKSVILNYPVVTHSARALFILSGESMNVTLPIINSELCK